MLGQFTFKNYKSFKDEAILDFIAEPINDLEHLIIDVSDGEKFLPVIAIYGPNGGGKSTVLEAISFLSMQILSKVIALKVLEEENDEIDKLKRMFSNSFKEKYYKFDEMCKDRPIEFDLLFRFESSQFRYQLGLLHNQIIEENLYMQVCTEKDAEIVFERDKEDCYLGEILNGVSVDKVKGSMPLLSHIAINYDIDIVDKIIKWFFGITYLDYDNPQLDKSIMIPEEKQDQKILLDMLKEMDINIVDFRVEEDSDGNITDIYTKHKLSEGEMIEIPFYDESSGTRKLFGVLPRIIRCLKQGNLMIADELDAKLHPKLIRYIIELFTNSESNKNGAQLLLTSHDMYTMSPQVLRRDEIWFCALNQDNASKLYPLVTFKKENGSRPRNDESYNKQYIEGRYGADPYLRKILDWGEKY